MECAAISHKYLGAAYDIHVSGADETFPHCENILAINKAFPATAELITGLTLNW